MTMLNRVACQLVLAVFALLSSAGAQAYGSLTIVLDKSPPFYAPLQLQATVRCTYDKGHKPVGVTIFLNGVQLRNDSCGETTFPLALGQGMHVLSATASDIHGHEWDQPHQFIEVQNPGDTPPQVSMNPISGGPFITPAVIALSANASDSDGNVVSVEYYANREPIGSSAQPPFNFDWTARAGGDYSITALATDNHGYMTVSQPVMVAVESTRIMGAVEGVRRRAGGEFIAKGWACTTGRNAPIDVRIYARGPVGGGGVLLGQIRSEQASEPGLASVCRAQGTAYRFSFVLTAQILASHPNEKLYVYGVSPYGFGDELIGGAGVHAVPGPMSVVRRFVYDDYQQLCKTIEPETGATVTAYDGSGNVEWSAAGLNLPDASNCSHSEAYSSGRRVDRVYDLRNRLQQLSFPDGRGNQVWDYFPDGLTKTVTTSNDGPGTGNVVNAYVYDKRRNLVGETQAQPGQYSWSVGYGYDDTANLRWLTYPTGTLVDYAPNALGQPRQVVAGGRNFASAIKYFPNGALASFVYGNGITHTATQNARQLPLRVLDAGTIDLKIGYDANGNPIEILDGVRGETHGRWMAYDDLDRLTAAGSCSFGGDCWYRFAYDGVDNIKSWSLGGVGDRYFYYDARNQLINIRDADDGAVVGLGYDAQGNQDNKNGQAYAFDYGNRLREVLGKEVYRYDALGRRVQSTRQPGSVGRSMYSQEGQLLYAEQSGAATSATEYLYLGDSLLATRETAGTGLPAMVRYQHNDLLGSPLAISDEAGTIVQQMAWEPYGAAIGQPTYDGIGYTGHLMDGATGLTYMQQRYYDAQIGRFLSADPVETDTQTGDDFNRYAYAYNNPFAFFDPDGRQADEVIDRQVVPTMPPVRVLTPATALGPSGGFSPVGGFAPPPTTTFPKIEVRAPIIRGIPWGLALPHLVRAAAPAGGYLLLLVPVPIGAADCETAGGGACAANLQFAAEHTKNARPSTKGKHEKGKSRKKADKHGGEKGDDRRGPRGKRPPGYKGPWPPKG